MTFTRIFLTALINAALLAAQTSTLVLTRSYDNGRTGANTTESTFTPALVAAKGLQRIKSLNIKDDPRIEAQPLYVPKLVMKKDGKEHNVVFVASMGNHVFAFDADAKQGKDLLWTSPQLGPPLNPAKDPGSGPKATVVDLYGINQLWGILSTPVIDLDANQMYIVNWIATSKDRKSHALRLHRIRLDDGSEVNGPGLPITGVLNGADGKPVVDARGRPVELGADQKQRAALLLSPLRGHKILFIGITGGETPGDPHGWLVAFDVDTFTETAAIPTTQLGFGGGIWQGAQGPSSDDQGNVFVMTGNGGFNAKKGPGDTNPGTIGDFTVSGKTDFAEAFVKFNYQKSADGKGTLTIADWFIPFRDSLRKNVNGYDYQDQDLGSGAPILPPGTNLLLGAGKDGLLYVLDRENLGKSIGTSSVPPVYITFNGLGLATSGPSLDYPLGGGPLQPAGAPTKTHHLHASPAFWNGPNGPRLFDWGENESLRAWSLDTTPKIPVFIAKGAEISSNQMALSTTGNGGMTGGMISVSSDGKNNGIVWTLAPIDGNANTDVVKGIARAYDATTLDATTNADGTAKLKLLWDSGRSGVTFDFSKFCPPMVADGKLYVTTYDKRVDVYVLKP